MIAIRPPTALILALGATLATLQPLSAQGLRGNAESGRHTAINLCSGCHRVDSSTFGIFAADFTEIAKLPSTTALSLRVFVQSSHKNMPNIMLEPEQSDDVIAYIMSLKRR